MIKPIVKDKADRKEIGRPEVNSTWKRSRGSAMLRADTEDLLKEFFEPHNEARAETEDTEKQKKH